MINDEILKNQLQEISEVIQAHYSQEEDIGVLSGVSGMALFYFYYAKYLDDDSFSDIGVEMISHCIEKINKGYSFPTYCRGIAGFGWAIQHLNDEGFIELDFDNLLEQFDEYLYDQMKLDLIHNNFDYLHGAIGYGFYFLKRYHGTVRKDLKIRYVNYLKELVQELEKLAIKEGNCHKWESILNFELEKKGFNLGLAHGMSSVLNFLARLNEIETLREITERLVNGGTNYILGFEKKDSKMSLFPNWITQETSVEYRSRLGWCYGDLGIGLSLMHVAESFNDSAMQEHALDIFSHTTSRRVPNETLVSDAGMCHGSYGNALIYKRLFQKSGDEKYLKSFNFWIEEGIKMAIHEDGYAGYMEWNPNEKRWSSELHLLGGVAGIGLVIIDYFSEESSLWDECFMIS